MSNSIVSRHFHSTWRYIYGIGLVVLILAGLTYGLSFGVNYYITIQSGAKQADLNQIQQKVRQLGSEERFFKYDFAQKMNKQDRIKRSAHISALVKVLQEIQRNDYVGANAISLSDFSLTPDSISLKGKVSNLILLYYSSKEKNYTSVIDRFATLPFISDIAIKRYTKVGNYYEFNLTAKIDLNATATAIAATGSVVQP
ncbi:hypothetical protein KAZ93_02080 [Patescibacteria group bacterium]|nr:hypothetical protein [Patescibacteria group bacterium]